MTPAELQSAIELATTAADVALPLAGHAELVPIANAVSALASKIAAYVQTRQGDAAIAAAMQAARVAADAAELAKFGPSSGS